jgi:hypothetical protein
VLNNAFIQSLAVVFDRPAAAVRQHTHHTYQYHNFKLSSGDTTCLAMKMVTGRHVSLFLTVLAVTHQSVKAFVSTCPSFLSSCNNGPSSQTIVRMAEEVWDGHVASNTEDGSIRGCKLTLEPGTLTDWTITIDG